MTLVKKAGLAQDPLTAGKLFFSRCQLPGEKSEDNNQSLEEIIQTGLPRQEVNLWHSAQHFLTALTSPIS